MKRIFGLTIALVLAQLLVNCGGTSAERRKAGESPTPTPAPIAENTAKIVRMPFNGNNDSTAPVGNGSAGSKRDMRGKERVDVNPSATPIPPTFRKAPENSQYASTMDKSGEIVEIRVFRSDKRLVRVEARWNNPKEKKLRFFFKNGKTIELVTDKVSDLQNAEINALVKLAESAAVPQ
jgi:hypothetical protein